MVSRVDKAPESDLLTQFTTVTSSEEQDTPLVEQHEVSVELVGIDEAPFISRYAALRSVHWLQDIGRVPQIVGNEVPDAMQIAPLLEILQVVKDAEPINAGGIVPLI